MDDLGQELYQAYVLDAGGLNYQSKPCPLWQDLPPETQQHWCAVAETAKDSIIESVRDELDKMLK